MVASESTTDGVPLETYRRRFALLGAVWTPACLSQAGRRYNPNPITIRTEELRPLLAYPIDQSKVVRRRVDELIALHRLLAIDVDDVVRDQFHRPSVAGRESLVDGPLREDDNHCRTKREVDFDPRGRQAGESDHGIVEMSSPDDWMIGGPQERARNIQTNKPLVPQ